MSALSGGPCCTTCIRVEGAYGHAYPAKQPSNDTGGALNLSFAGGITAEALAVHPSGQYGAYACDDNVVLWAWKADKRLFLNCQGAVVSSCCFSSDGVYAFAGTSAPNPGVYVFDIAVGKPVQVALGSHRFQEFSSISHIAVAHDSRLVAAVETQKEGFAHLHIWDWTRGFVPVSCECLFSAAPRAVLWMPPGRIVTVCREEVILWAVFGKTVEKLARRAADASLYADYTAAAASPTNGLLYVSCGSGKMLVMDSALQLLATVDVPGPRPCAVAVSSRTVLVGDGSGSIHIYDETSLTRQQTLPFQDQVRSVVAAGGSAAQYTAPVVALSGGRNNVVLALTADALLLALDLAALSVSAFSIGHFGSGLALAFDPASPHTVATSSIDQTVNVWTNLGQRIAYSFLDIPSAVDARVTALRRQHWAREDPVSGAEVANSLAYHPAGRVFAAGCSSGFVRLFDGHSGAQQAILDAGGGQIVHVSFSPDGRWLSCVRADGSLHVYDSQANFATMHVHDGGGPVACFLGTRAAALVDVRDDSVFVVGTQHGTTLSVYQLSKSGSSYTNAVAASFNAPASIRAFCVHPCGEYVFVACGDSRVHIFHVIAGVSRGSFVVGGAVHAMACDPSGLYLAVAVAGSTYWSVDLYETGTGRYSGGVVTAPVRDIAFAPDASRLAAVSRTGAILQWEIVGGMKQNINGVLASVAEDPQFWTNYPIYLPDAQPLALPIAFESERPLPAIPMQRAGGQPPVSPSFAAPSAQLPRDDGSARLPAYAPPAVMPLSMPSSPTGYGLATFRQQQASPGGAALVEPQQLGPSALMSAEAATARSAFSSQLAPSSYPSQQQAYGASSAQPVQQTMLPGALLPQQQQASALEQRATDAFPTVPGGEVGDFSGEPVAAAVPPRQPSQQDGQPATSQPAGAPIAPLPTGAATAPAGPQLSDREIHRLAQMKASERQETLEELDRFDERVHGPRKGKKMPTAPGYEPSAPEPEAKHEETAAEHQVVVSHGPRSDVEQVLDDIIQHVVGSSLADATQPDTVAEHADEGAGAAEAEAKAATGEGQAAAADAPNDSSATQEAGGGEPADATGKSTTEGDGTETTEEKEKAAEEVTAESTAADGQQSNAGGDDGAAPGADDAVPQREAVPAAEEQPAETEAPAVE